MQASKKELKEVNAMLEPAPAAINSCLLPSVSCLKTDNASNLT